MHLSQIVALLPIVISVVRAEDVTLYEAARPTVTSSPRGGQPAGAYTVLGATPLSVDEAGATHYAYSFAASIDWETSTEVNIITRTVQDDGTRAFEQGTMTVSRGIPGVHEDTYECFSDHENGTAVCHARVVVKQSDTTFTAVDTTRTGTPSPWVTIKNVNVGSTALPTASSATDDDEGDSDTGGARSLGACVFGTMALIVASILSM